MDDSGKRYHVNAAAKFQTVMDRELAVAGLDNETTCYIDDLCVHHDEWGDHLKALERVFAMCNATGLRLHPDKSKFGLATVEFLGHKVGGNGVTPDEAKVKAIMGMGRPESASDLRNARVVAATVAPHDPVLGMTLCQQ